MHGFLIRSCSSLCNRVRSSAETQPAEAFLSAIGHSNGLGDTLLRLFLTGEEGALLYHILADTSSTVGSQQRRAAGIRPRKQSVTPTMNSVLHRTCQLRKQLSHPWPALQGLSRPMHAAATAQLPARVI